MFVAYTMNESCHTHEYVMSRMRIRPKNIQGGHDSFVTRQKNIQDGQDSFVFVFSSITILMRRVLF